MMYERLVLMWELLAEDGSIWVHLDWRVDSHIRLLLDEVFGARNFRNEIVWAYRTGGAPSIEGGFPRKHDVILYYSKTDQFSQTFKLKERVYYEKPFFTTQQDRQGRYYADVLLRDVLEGELQLVEGQRVNTVSVKPVINVSNERLGFDTQKPEGLLKVIIMASSNEGDLVAGFFCVRKGTRVWVPLPTSPVNGGGALCADGGGALCADGGGATHSNGGGSLQIGRAHV